MGHEATASGELSLRVIPAPPKRPSILTVKDAILHGGSDLAHNRYPKWLPLRERANLMRWQWANRHNFERSLRDQAAVEEITKHSGALAAIGHLWLAKVDKDGKQWDLGLASCRVVTNAGVGYIVDAFQNLVELENMKFHAVGTGGTAESATQTALVTELTTQYATSSTRPTGSLGEQSGNSNVFETAATITVSASVALTEHAIMSQAATGGGTMLDRTLFSVVNLNSGESLQATYDFTLTSGG